MNRKSDDVLPPRAPAKHDGKRFYNQVSTGRDTSLKSVLRWQVSREPGTWDKWRPLDPDVAAPPPERVDDGDALRVTFINHATLLLQTGGVNIVTDPVWSQRCSPSQRIGPKRHRPPGVAFDDLPPVDVVLLSHDHYDHLDLPTMRRLAQRDRPQIIAGLGVGQYLASKGVPGAVELDWWQETTTDAGGFRVTATPTQHFAGRGLRDRHKRLWVAPVIEAPGGPILFGGDTGWGPHFAQVADHFGPMRLALLPIGAYRPEWFMSAVHINPAEAVEAHRVLAAKQSVAIHFGTFRLADDGQDEPVDGLREALARTDIGDDAFWVLDHGEGRDVAPL